MERFPLIILSKRFVLSWIVYIGLFFLLGTQVYADDVTITWNPNGEGDLAGYNLYWGTASRKYPNSVDVGNKTTYTISGLNKGQTYYFAVTAYDTSNNESIWSSEVVYAMPIMDSNGGGEVGGGESGGGEGGGGGCFIATAAYGSSVEPHVKILREFRDRIVINNSFGSFKSVIHGD
jgi:hypothetical protein